MTFVIGLISHPWDARWRKELVDEPQRNEPFKCELYNHLASVHEAAHAVATWARGGLILQRALQIMAGTMAEDGFGKCPHGMFRQMSIQEKLSASRGCLMRSRTK